MSISIPDPPTQSKITATKAPSHCIEKTITYRIEIVSVEWLVVLLIASALAITLKLIPLINAIASWIDRQS